MDGQRVRDLALRYEIRIVPNEVGRFSVDLPDWPNVVTSGRTREEALAGAQAALEFAVETFLEQGQPLPEPGRAAA
jgi:predicted RNase H-like HicB family nuclease